MMTAVRMHPDADQHIVPDEVPEQPKAEKRCVPVMLRPIVPGPEGAR